MIDILINALKIFGGLLVFDCLLAVWLYLRPDAKPHKVRRMGKR